MELNTEVGKISKLLLQVLTPIMVVILLIFFGTGYLIFKAPSISPTFNFDLAFWSWLIVCWAFTPLCGAILWIQSVRALQPTKKRRTRPPQPPSGSADAAI
ncbi:hypothetical protein [Paenibacillus amylolyticus]|uniref:hypothetical protein n=1 Tax=Paenibacillus amylolyticus TaxID=1451 RepID=UPI003D95535A